MIRPAARGYVEGSPRVSPSRECPMPVLRRSPRPVAVSLAIGGLLAAGLSAAGPAAGRGPAPTAPRPQPPRRRSWSRPRPAGGSLPAAARGARPEQPGDPADLACCRRADGQPIRFDLGRESVTGGFTHMEHNRAYTAWTGSLDVDLGTFTIVRSGSIYRASIISPQGLWEVTQAEGSRYWLTAVAPYPGPSSGADTITQRPTRAERQRMAAATTPAAAQRAGPDPHRRALRLHPVGQGGRGQQGRRSRPPSGRPRP